MRRVFLGILVAACAAHAQMDEAVPLRFWHSTAGHEGKALLRVAKAFPGNLVACRVDHTVYRSKLLARSADRDAPDVFLVHASDLGEFVQARRLLPLDDLVSADESADLFAPAWRATAIDARHYGFPVNVRVLAMFCNTRCLSNTGLTPPRTRQELLDMLSQRASAPRNIVFSLGWLRASVATLMVQHGGSFWSEDGTHCTLDSLSNVEGLAFCLDLSRRGGGQRHTAGDAWLELQKGRVACMFGESTLAGKSTEITVRPVPAVGARPAAWADSRVLCLRADLDGARKARAWALVRYLSDHALDWLADGELPARTSQLAAPRVTGNDTRATLARELPMAFFLPPSQRFLAEFDSAIDDVMFNDVPPQTALERAASRLNATPPQP